MAVRPCFTAILLFCGLIDNNVCNSNLYLIFVWELKSNL